MDLVERFAPQAGANGVFKTEINFSEFFKGHDLGSQRGKDNFLHHARRACHELGIVVGYNETPTGFALGFETKADHDRFMAVVEPRMELDARKDQRGIEKLMRAYGLDPQSPEVHDDGRAYIPE